jgi:hypothetical protein
VQDRQGIAQHTVSNKNVVTFGGQLVKSVCANSPQKHKDRFPHVSLRESIPSSLTNLLVTQEIHGAGFGPTLPLFAKVMSNPP